MHSENHHFSYAFTFVEIAWDFERYKEDPEKQAKAISVDLLNLATNIGVNYLITFPTGGWGLFLSVSTSTVIDLFYDDVKDNLL